MSSEAPSVSSCWPSESKQGLRGSRVSNERYPASSFKRIVMFDALATTVDSNVLGQMQVLVTISSKVDFIQKTMSVSLHRLIRASMGSFPTAFIAPSWNMEYLDTFSYSTEVVTYTHKRSKSCCRTGRTFPSILPWYGAQSMIQANHCPPPRPCIPIHYAITDKSLFSLPALALGFILPFLGFYPYHLNYNPS
jgi:hypothetical protein